MPHQLTPEWIIGKKKHFPVRSRLSGYTPEKVDSQEKKFPAAQSKLLAGTLALTPEKNSKGVFFPTQSKVNT